ncbi:hypothetical protein ACJMK2_034916 [Sinanodonta woodiana]|uniref:Uncharacterized protein n=1 Tax=Sinanodonta woodiana TaxID=1069815 RepID=A0ABD3WX17_SINWO
MAYIVLFSFIVLPWTICVVNGAVSSHQRCIIKSSSRYSVVSQYCTSESILELKVKQAKEDVCDEMLQLYDQMCSFNRSSTAFDWPKPHNVSKTNCLSICAELDTKYISRMFDEGSGSCVTLCTKDLEAVAVLSTLFQLKDFIAELKKNQTVETVTNSTSEQSASSPGAEGNKSAQVEPDSKPSTAATGENASASIEAVTTLRPVATEKKVPSTKLVPNLTTTATTRPSPAKSAVKSTTPTEKMNVSSAKPDLNATTTAAAENGSALKEASTNLKPINTAAEQIYSTPKEEDRTLKPVATGKTPSPNLKINTTGERIVSSPNKDVKKTEQEDLDKTTNSKEEQEDLDKTTNSKKEQEDLDKTTNSKKEQEDLDKTTNSKKEQEDLDKTTNSKKEQEDLDKTTNSKKEQEDLDKTTNSKKEQDDLDKTTNSKEGNNIHIIIKCHT